MTKRIPFKRLSEKLLTWYERHGRHELPWRIGREPYDVLVSEMMLQQTQVNRVIDFFERWMQRFPNIDALADASEDDVIRVWQGLGYYRRARSLHTLARVVVSEHNGELPRDAAALQKLPGIGPYSAGAICAFAYNQPEPALDTNIRRVLQRWTLCDDADLEEIGRKLLLRGEPWRLTSALMDLGATLCTARGPTCGECPMQNLCHAYREKAIVEAPKRRAAKHPKAAYAIGVIRDGKQVLLAPRKGLLVAELNGQGAREALQLQALRAHGVEIAVRPAYAHGGWQGKSASFHRCSLLVGKIEGFKVASPKQIARLSKQEREVLHAVKLLNPSVS